MSTLERRNGGNERRRGRENDTSTTTTESTTSASSGGNQNTVDLSSISTRPMTRAFRKSLLEKMPADALKLNSLQPASGNAKKASTWDTLDLPRSLEDLYISIFRGSKLTRPFQVIDREESSCTLEMKLSLFTPAIWIELFTKISQSCPSLKKLTISVGTITCDVLERWQSIPRALRSEIPRYSFPNLKELDCTVEVGYFNPGIMNDMLECGTAVLLMDVLQVHQMSLRKCPIDICIPMSAGAICFSYAGSGSPFSAENIESILVSPLGKSLVEMPGDISRKDRSASSSSSSNPLWNAIEKLESAVRENKEREDGRKTSDKTDEGD